MDTAKVRIVPPRIGDGVVERIQALVGKEGEDVASDLTDLGRELRETVEGATIVITVATATRRGGFRRSRALRDALGWLEAAGYGKDTRWSDIPEDIVEQYIILQQAASILGALVPEELVNWAPPAALEGWLDVPDYIFSPILAATWEMNPHWAPEVARAEKN